MSKFHQQKLHISELIRCINLKYFNNEPETPHRTCQYNLHSLTFLQNLSLTMPVVPCCAIY